ncbi:IST1 homolog [Daktulosphaira vitifoliae]|uniref:IST1 homolog n=1 Tax=Daktulosphaira vitifoliae TaxID=58002 RepID=UPI0021AA30FC|nr:IST1 homolog [Daktulosphaira vitifoliae]XP_050541727.1 IST1 homolog [Daktulosphaira vitifoliae]XP_050541728.1 IST1 homolog [Daktulosphaira vitifoliae]
MFSSDANYSKLKTNLRLALNRLKLLEKKKAELAQKSRKEIADMVAAGKSERAKIRVEHIIREDYFVEALEIVEMYCDSLLSRFGLLQQSKTLDSTLQESVSSLLWVSPHIQADISEMKVISDQLTQKFGKKYAESCRSENMDTVSQKLKHKLSLRPPPKILVEKYLIEISKNYRVPYEPDLQVMQEYEQSHSIDSILFDNQNTVDGAQRPTGFIGFPQQPIPIIPPMQMPPISYPNMSNMSSMLDSTPLDFDIPPSGASAPTPVVKDPPIPKPRSSNNVPQNNSKPNPLMPNKGLGFSNLPDLPSVPTDIPTGDIKDNGDDDDNEDDGETNFDDLLNRFEDLKKNKK